MQRTRDDWDRIIKGGLFAGPGAGATVLAYDMIRAGFATGDPWGPVKIAAPFVAKSPLAPGFDAAAVLGLGVHSWLSALLGVVFAAAFYDLSKSAALPVGGLFGVAVWFVVSETLLPVAGIAPYVPTAGRAIEMLDHMLFGLTIAVLYLPYQRDGWQAVPVWARMRGQPDLT